MQGRLQGCQVSMGQLKRVVDRLHAALFTVHCACTTALGRAPWLSVPALWTGCSALLWQLRHRILNLGRRDDI